jgi:hypothetical protein
MIMNLEQRMKTFNVSRSIVFKKHLLCLQIKSKYREANKDKIIQEQKEKIAERNKKYRESNKEKIAKQRKEYREANKEKIAERNKKYREANKEK